MYEEEIKNIKYLQSTLGEFLKDDLPTNCSNHPRQRNSLKNIPCYVKNRNLL